jgi:hypothetical protein
MQTNYLKDKPKHKNTKAVSRHSDYCYVPGVGMKMSRPTYLRAVEKIR